MQHEHIVPYKAKKCWRVALWLHTNSSMVFTHSSRRTLSNIRMQIISSTFIRVNAITSMTTPPPPFLLWIFALFITNSSQWDKLSVKIWCSSFTFLCPILETSIFMVRPSSKIGTRYIYFLKCSFSHHWRWWQLCVCRTLHFCRNLKCHNSSHEEDWTLEVL